jgi:hypothetical protein
LRALVDRVDLMPENGELAIMLRGDLAAILSFAANKKPGAISGTGFSVISGCGGQIYRCGAVRFRVDAAPALRAWPEQSVRIRVSIRRMTRASAEMVDENCATLISWRFRSYDVGEGKILPH